MIQITREQLLSLAPNAKETYLTAFLNQQPLTDAGINATARRVAYFMAQILHETGGLTILIESLNYSTPERLMIVWPSRFPTVEIARQFVHNPEGLAEKVYGGRMGNISPGDAFRYIGRGMLQITGKEAYAKFGKRLGVDLVGFPDMAMHPNWSLKIAASEWAAKFCNELADARDFTRVTKAINGGTVGLASRREWLSKTARTWPEAGA